MPDSFSSKESKESEKGQCGLSKRTLMIITHIQFYQYFNTNKMMGLKSKELILRIKEKTIIRIKI